MFNLFKKKAPVVSAREGLPYQTDIHSHILPGVDDGAADVSQSVELISGLYALGIRRCVATPHIIGDLYRNTPETIRQALETARAACTAANIPMQLEAAAEYMLDDYFMKLLAGEPLLTIQDNYLLTELPYSILPHNIGEMVFAMITSGYQPILAHPERYFYFHRDFEQYRRFKEFGFHLQVNLLSLTGYYGKEVAQAAKYILDKGLASFVGTDLHHKRHLAALQNERNQLIFNKYLGNKGYNSLIKQS